MSQAFVILFNFCCVALLYINNAIQQKSLPCFGKAFTYVQVHKKLSNFPAKDVFLNVLYVLCVIHLWCECIVNCFCRKKIFTQTVTPVLHQSLIKQQTHLFLREYHPYLFHVIFVYQTSPRNNLP